MRKVFILLLFLPLLMVFCQEKQKAADGLSPEIMKKVVGSAQSAAGGVITTLKGELMAAIQKKGVAGSIDICKARALVITDSLAGLSPQIVDIRRTTFKYRNPLNAPDEMDKDVLKTLEQSAASDTLPQFIVRKYPQGGQTHYRYYMPLVAQPLCLNCHGDKATMQEDVRTVIAENYPGDLAYGYQAGQFRGVIRVTVAID